VTLLPGPEKCECPCGCGLFGTPKKNGCVRNCTCPRCRGRRNRAKGARKQKVAQKRLGVPQQKFGDHHEEGWADELFRNEVKAGKQVGPATTVWLRIEAQVDSNRPDFGDDGRPCRAVLMPDGMSDGLVMVRLSTWERLIRPAMDAHYGGGA